MLDRKSIYKTLRCKETLLAGCTLAAPFLFATVALWRLGEINTWDLFEGLAVRAHLVIFILLAAGYLLTGIGTLVYAISLASEFDKLPGEMKKGWLWAAFGLCVSSVAALFLGVVIFLVRARKPFSGSQDILSVLHWNDISLCLIFFVFLLIDLMIWKGSQDARNFLTSRIGAETECHNAHVTEKYAIWQILYIDVPVILLIASAMVIIGFMENNPVVKRVDLANMGINEAALTKSVTACRADTACRQYGFDGSSLDFIRMKEEISNSFMVGISGGLVGAHVVFSQVVFLFLTVSSLFEKKEPRPSGLPPGNLPSEPRNPTQGPVEVQVPRGNSISKKGKRRNR